MRRHCVLAERRTVQSTPVEARRRSADDAGQQPQSGVGSGLYRRASAALSSRARPQGRDRVDRGRRRLVCAARAARARRQHPLADVCAATVVVVGVVVVGRVDNSCAADARGWQHLYVDRCRAATWHQHVESRQQQLAHRCRAECCVARSRFATSIINNVCHLHVHTIKLFHCT
jgi:hypothetical protein